MAKEKIEKTNAMRILDRAKIAYIHRCWEDATAEHTGVELAAALQQNAPAETAMQEVSSGAAVQEDPAKNEKEPDGKAEANDAHGNT